VTVQPDRQDRQPAARRETPPSRPAGRKALPPARDWFEGSVAQSFVRQLKELDFASQAMLFGAGLLVSVLPFVILMSAFVSQRVDDDISLRMGLNRRAAGIVDHLQGHVRVPGSAFADAEPGAADVQGQQDRGANMTAAAPGHEALHRDQRLRAVRRPRPLQLRRDGWEAVADPAMGPADRPAPGRP